jgi:hemolysin III
MIPTHVIRDPQSPSEERFNFLTHGFALVLSLIGLGALLVLAGQRDLSTLAACAVYGISLIILFATSTFYHACALGSVKSTARILDHCAIPILIAGSYTPLMVLALGHDWRGWSVLLAVWAMAAYGIRHKFTSSDPFGAASVVLCLVMGWLVVLVWHPLVACAPGAAGWLVAGGVAYTAGVPFYAWSKLPYNHGIWHLFVMAGAACHYVAVLKLL